jgi:hypothetical protein
MEMLRRILPLVAALAACTSTPGPEESTPTVDPPVLDPDGIRLESGRFDAHIKGEPGTASGGSIEVTNLTTGVMIQAQINGDGSFDFVAPGLPGDAYAVRVTQGGGLASEVVYVAGGAAVLGEDDGELSCPQYVELATAVLDASVEAAEKSCFRDEDCIIVLQASSCYGSCEPIYVHRTGAQEIDKTARELDDGLCDVHREQRCRSVDLQCELPPPVSCLAGQCTTPSAALSCEERTETAERIVAEAVAAADTSCARDSDCMRVGVATFCTARCDLPVVSSTGESQILTALGEVNGGVCANFMRDGCSFTPQPCDPPSGLAPSCEAGHCALGPAVPRDDCTRCFDATLTWGLDGGLMSYRDRSELRTCARYTHSRMPEGEPTVDPISCQRDLVACNAVASTSAVNSALSKPDVASALRESPVLYGTDPRGMDGTVFQLEFGTRVIEVGGSCEGAGPNCIPPPPGVQALVDLLRTIDEQMLSTEECSAFVQ